MKDALRQRRHQSESLAHPRPHVDETIQLRAELLQKRRSITLLRAPLKTLVLFFGVVWDWQRSIVRLCVLNKRIVLSLISFVIGLFLASLVEGSHRLILDELAREVRWDSWWLLLGLLSSVGLGTGLHTFVLYLGPFIAKCTMAATECGTTHFDISGPLAFICPSTSLPMEVGFWKLMRKVQWTCVVWGLGTALGELPPYFVALAASQSGEEVEAPNPGVTFMDKVRKVVDYMLHRYGFLAIIIFASVPNPLFDLAGLTCGHFGVPFAKFFGATLFGKAFVKVHIQMFLVIVMFNPIHLENIGDYIPSLQGPIRVYFQEQRSTFHHPLGDPMAVPPRSVLSHIWNVILVTMVLGFVISGINACVQQRLADLDEIKWSRSLEASVNIDEEDEEPSLLNSPKNTFAE